MAGEMMSQVQKNYDELYKKAISEIEKIEDGKKLLVEDRKKYEIQKFTG